MDKSVTTQGNLTECRRCKTPFVRAHFNVVFCSDVCRAIYQKKQKKQSAQKFYLANKAEHYQQSKIWKHNNQDKCRQHRSKHYHAFRDAEHAAHSAWVAKNREHVRAYEKDYRRQIRAVDEGKSDMRFRVDGFSLVVSLAGKNGRYWRAAPQDKSIGKTERVVARYEPISQPLGAVRWCVLTPALASAGTRDEMARLARRERLKARPGGKEGVRHTI